MNIPAKKSLGQNFLKSKEALRLIQDAAQLSATDTILEIGPGKGALTEYLLAKESTVIAVEKDEELIELLKEKFASHITSGKLKLISADILEIDLDTFIDKNKEYKLAANIPYYITGAIIKKFLTETHQPSRMVLLVQKEVAERIVARDGKESILSLSVKAYGKPKYVKTVQAKYFSPEPNVDSAILLVSDITRNFFQNISEEKYFELVKTGFAHKRKMLVGNIKELFKDKNLEEIFTRLNISLKTRAEDLKLEDWKKLTQELN